MSDVVVFRTWDESIAEMAVQFLRAEDIAVIWVADVPRSILPTTMDGIGEIEIRVPEPEADRAMEILAARFSEAEMENGDSGA